MSTFIEMLEERSQKEPKVRAVLKRSLSFDPGAYPPAFPYVERRLGEDDGNWKRSVYYLVAGLWAMNRKDGYLSYTSLPAITRSIDQEERKNSLFKEKQTSIEKRFITLLDADEDQLPHRLRQMVMLLKEYAIDFEALLKDLISWNHPDKFVQRKWAKIFYQPESINNGKLNVEEKKENEQ